MKILEVTLPIRTTNPLNGAQGTTRGAMFARAKDRARQRDLTGLVLSPARRKLVKLLTDGERFNVTLTRIAPSEGLDDDSLPASMKAIRDAIADTCGLPSDRTPLIRWIYGQRRSKEYGVIVAIETQEG
jgi:hypothetical protein